MSHYQNQNKKKPLIQYHKPIYNQPTIAMKDKNKKQTEKQKQNIYEDHNTKNKDYQYQNQYYQTQNNSEMYKKPSIPLNQIQPFIKSNDSQSTNYSDISTPAKNLSFGTLKNNPKYYNPSMNNQTPKKNNNVFSVLPNMQYAPLLKPNFLDVKKINNKYQIKPINLKKHNQNQKPFNHNEKPFNQNQKPFNQDQKHYNLNQRSYFQNEKNLQKNQKNTAGFANQKDQTSQRMSILQRKNSDRNIEKNDRNLLKLKIKRQIKQKYAQSSSPFIEKQFLCDQQLDTNLTAFQRKPVLYERKISQKKLNPAQIANQFRLQNPNNYFNGYQQPSFCNPNSGIDPSTKYAPKKLDKKANDLNQIKQFQNHQDQTNIINASQGVNMLFLQQQKYMVDSMYLQKNQKYINWWARAILIDWMRQLSYQYSLRRDTYHLAVVLVDHFLSKKSNIQKQIIQTIGTTALFIASKLEQLQCRPSQQFAQATRGVCTDKDIHQWELQICKTLEYSLNPPTISSLANRVMQQWDKYIDQVDYAMHHLCFQGKQKVYFKKMDQFSYKYFRQLNQFIDCTIMDIQTTQYKPILIVLSLMYLIIGVKIAGFQHEQIHGLFPRSSQYLLDRSNYFNDLFQNFVQSSFALTLIELLPSIQYTATFFNLNLTYQKPTIEEDPDKLQNMNVQQYCSYQTYNRHMLKTVQTRFRGIMNVYDN